MQLGALPGTLIAQKDKYRVFLPIGSQVPDINQYHQDYAEVQRWYDGYLLSKRHIVELKWNQNAQTALQQIRERHYPQSLLQYTGNMLLVGINYDKKSKQHTCEIEEYHK